MIIRQAITLGGIVAPSFKESALNITLLDGSTLHVEIVLGEDGYSVIYSPCSSVVLTNLAIDNLERELAEEYAQLQAQKLVA
jgi:hypothetical protein